TVKDPETVISNFITQQISVHATNANSNACRTAVGMLFWIQGFQGEKINGFALKQIMKKHLAAIRKKRKEEPIYKLDIHLNSSSPLSPLTELRVTPLVEDAFQLSSSCPLVSKRLRFFPGQHNQLIAPSDLATMIGMASLTLRSMLQHSPP
ncbi:MAG: hypothetical protein EZS28_053252, partial [Streblomastix strix]